jgi:hypothetical protein
MTAIVLYRIDSARPMHGYYRVDVQPDLFGERYLMREWDASAAPASRVASPSRLRR